MLNSPQTEKNPWVSLLIIVLLSFGTALVSPLLFSYLVSLAVGADYSDVTSAFSQPDLFPHLKGALLTVQFLTSLSAFVLVPLYFIWQYEDRMFQLYFRFDNINPVAALTTSLLVLAFMVVNSVFIEWNMNIEFPESIATIAREMEDRGKVLTDYFTDFDTIPYFLFSIIVIAIVPAIGEELLFRGVIQRQVLRISGNVHVAVWLAAIFFSTFHFQFFGFVPRMLLGALFGYLFVYSGNLVYSIIAHFVNNGFTLLMIYLHQNDMVSYDIENTETVPLESVGIFAIIGAVLFVYFYKQMNPVGNPANE
ncbi:CPBP family intramembrane glutamic endopeptidase [Reichenbachiella sp. MALMAid0571]|uniref:CPBP family intramembrane glutamic endopeptidase n=1 Tax=Reichenbachiella sp. MALMAid0571 TaxID=3143939 RepID=UPI0032DF1A40